MKKKILITGGSGFIGSHLTDYLLKESFEIAWVSRTKPKFHQIKWIRIDEQLEINVCAFKPLCFVHLAASFDNSDIYSLIECNVELPLRIFKALSALPEENRKIIFSSSYWEYGDKKHPMIPIDFYSSSKKSLKAFVEYLCCYCSFVSTELVVYGTYGMSDTRKKLLDMLLEAAKSGIPIDISFGEQKLNLVHVADVCHAFFMAIERMIEGQAFGQKAYSICSNKEYSVKNLVDLIAGQEGAVLNVNFGAIPYRDVEVFDPVYINNVLPGWREAFSLPDYIADHFKD